MPLKKSVVRRLTLTVIAIVALVIAATGLVTNSIGQHYALESAREVLRFNSASLLNGIDRLMLSHNNEGVSELIQDTFEDIQIVTLVATEARCTEAVRHVQSESGPSLAFLGGEYSLAGTDALLFGIDASFVVVAVVAILLGAVALLIMFERSLNKPIRYMISGIRALAENDLSFRFRTDRKDEFGQVEESFDQMASRIELQSKELIPLTSSSR
jgi:methyl-accepting chemotaxis protein